MHFFCGDIFYLLWLRSTIHRLRLELDYHRQFNSFPFAHEFVVCIAEAFSAIAS